MSEISFINSLEAQNKKMEVMERYQVRTYVHMCVHACTMHKMPLFCAYINTYIRSTCILSSFESVAQFARNRNTMEPLPKKCLM